MHLLTTTLRRQASITILSAVLLLLIVGAFAFSWDGLTLVERWRETHSGAVFYAAHTRERVVALTFDDGPDPRYTPAVLDALKRHHAHGTFFVVGRMLASNPDLARRIVAEGNVLGNHTETHPHLEDERNPQVRRELEDCEQQIESITGERTYLFRPPRGYWNSTVYRDARQAGYRIVLWSLAFDRAAIKNPDQLAARVLRQVKPGDIILMHDGSYSKQYTRGATVREIDRIVTTLQARGYRFATVPELLHIAGNVPVKRPCPSVVRAYGPHNGHS